LIDIAHSIKMAIESLKSSKLRSGLTALGIIIGIAAVIATFTLGTSFGAFFSDQISADGSNYVMISSSKENLFFDQQVDVVRNSRGVAAASPILSGAGTVTFMGESRNYSISGVREEYAEIGSVPVMEGSFLSDQDSGAVIIGKKIAEDDFKNQITARSTVDITLFNNQTKQYETRTFRVKGIIGSDKTNIISGTGSNTAIYLPLSVVKEMTGKEDYPMIMAMSESEENVKEADDEIQKNLARNLGVSERFLNDSDRVPFSTRNQADMLEQVEEMTGRLQLFLVAIGGISLIVGSVGIMNIMFVTVTERTKEIGTFKALGYTSRDVLILFLIESIVISVLGGTVGTGLGLGIAYVGSSLLGVSMALPLVEIFLGIAVSTLIGVIAGVYPANRAAKMNPVDALRSI
jgi:ABC-type antimicrobial peptide transport system, permease component